MKRSLEETNDLGEEIAVKCYNKFDQLLSRGKPSSNEWTHLAAFVSVNDNNQIEILSIGTGTKCLGGDKQERGTEGCLLHDSHAEVIARRALMRLFYEEILNENNSILIKQDKNKFYLNKSLRLYLFVSYSPCGAAAYLSDPIKRPKLEHKNLNSIGEELYLKPGKGYATTSLSCTNKINRWIYQGLEGNLLNQLIISSIKLTGLIIQTDKDLSSIFKNIDVICVNNKFSYGPSLQRIRPCSMSIAWWFNLSLSSSSITVDGYLLGLTKKHRNKQKYAGPLAKCSLFKLYLQLMDDLSSTETSYAHAKTLSSNSLTNQFMLNNPQWIRTDPNIFYAFKLS
ncbi:unnamed protein product [Rotaria magnacalcarata]|uniref:tRNA-specific adenosine deaminase 1 n=4 Tax=Rotaria magnacalcarata TaxID=392030 RepID=A0A816LTI3_9BILA|nr:unnamed protein product [Rotaria magnacalcarata]